MVLSSLSGGRGTGVRSLMAWGVVERGWSGGFSLLVSYFWPHPFSGKSLISQSPFPHLINRNHPMGCWEVKWDDAHGSTWNIADALWAVMKPGTYWDGQWCPCAPQLFGHLSCLPLHSFYYFFVFVCTPPSLFLFLSWPFLFSFCSSLPCQGFRSSKTPKGLVFCFCFVFILLLLSQEVFRAGVRKLLL